jgi:hypothetical protein
MSWQDYYRRRDIIDAVLRRAAHDPRGPVPFAVVPGARESFDSEENLLLALHYKWTRLLGGHLRTELLDDTDHVAAAGRAWIRASREHPTLHALLDAHRDRYPSLRAVHEAAQRMLALAAGLALPGERATEITGVGAALEVRLRQGGNDPERDSPRMLAPSR